MQALMAADGAGLAEAERRLKVRRDALARLDYAAIHAELSQRIKEPIATLTVARMQERADASLTKLIDETLDGAGSVGAGAGGADNAGTAMMAGVSGEQARVLRRELEAAGRVLVTNAELGRALVDETLRAAGGAKQVSATALAAVPKVAAVVTLVKARVLAAQKRIEGLMEWVVRARKDLAVATKGGK